MILPVAELKRLVGEQKKVHWLEPIQSFDLTETDMKLNEAVMAEVTVTNAGDRFLVQGSAIANFTMTCCRCLVEFPQQLTVELTEQYLFVSKGEPDDDEEDYEVEDRYLPVLAADQIDVSRLLVDAFFSQLPLKTLCREDCKGLCDQCGANLNEGPCECQDQPVDPRFAILSQWGKKSK